MQPRPLLRLLLLALLFLPFRPFAASAYEETRIVPNGTGKPIFQLHFLSAGEAFGSANPGETSTRPLTPQEKDATEQAARLWAEILGPGANNTSPASIVVGTNAEENAAAESKTNQAWQGGPWEGFSGLAGALIGDQAMNPPGVIVIGSLPLYSPAYPSPVATGASGSDMVAVLYHEIAHGLGIFSSAGESGEFSTSLSTWDKHLVDQYGTTVAPGMKIVLADPNDPSQAQSGDFIVGEGVESGVYFRGSYVSEVLAGAMDGKLTINGLEEDESGQLKPELSHIELARGLMSHQDYRNYTTFMEAELAVLQDLGHAIDRRNVYGFSVYDDGQTIVNTNGFFARTAQGDAYLTGAANTASYGVGLHIYGSGNDITQAADLLAGGTAGTGVRVDGSGNTLRVAPGVRVQADGAYGTGLLVAYGKEHTVISAGDVQALGYGGVAARFDFGHNTVGDANEYRGSYVHTVEGADGPLSGPDNAGFELNLDGALVDRFDVTGRLAGSAAAIFISENALVRNINIMRGASLSGAIVSKWDATNSSIQYTGPKEDLAVNLNFGLLPDATGAASTNPAAQAPDPSFNLRYDGAIKGPDSIRLGVRGGFLSFNGEADVLDVAVAEGATLGGNAVYTLTTLYDNNGASIFGNFINEGTLAPGNSIGTIQINGGYQQTATGRLAMEFDAAGNHDQLIVSGGDAILEGTLALSPMRDYYNQPLTLTLTDMVQVTNTLDAGSLSTEQMTSSLSPTLGMRLVQNGAGAASSFSLTPFRASDAYSRYALGDAETETARAIDTWAGQARGDARALMAALDFSAADGSGLNGAFQQLGPGLYALSGEASLSALRGVSNMLLFGHMPGSGERPSGLAGGAAINSDGSSDGSSASGSSARPGSNAGQRRFFASPLGGYGRNGASSGKWTSAYGGALAGLETELPQSSGMLTLGGHAAFTHRKDRFSGSGTNSATSESFFIGGHGRYDFSALPGSYAFGLLRLGVEHVEAQRSVDFNGYSRTAEADWLSPNLSALFGGGHDFRLGEISLGPVAWLDYSLSWRPDIRERGGEAIDLRLQSQTSQSLRSSLGGRFSAAIPTERLPLNAALTAVWNHEFLASYGTAKARFADMGGPSFARTAKVSVRDSASFALTLSGALSESLNLGLSGGVDAGGGNSAAWGGLRLDLTF